jgi:hypothetical protein
MALESPGFANQASSYSAEVARRAIFSAYARTAANTPGILAGGLLSTADMQLSAPVSGMSVNVSTGEAIVGGSEGGVQGGYYTRNASQTNLAISTANPTNPRIDTACVTIADVGYGEPTGVSGNAAVLQVVTGTPTSGANLTNLSGKASLPLSSLLLGYCLVPNSATNIITADIANKATVVGLLTGLNYLQTVSTARLAMNGGNSTVTFTASTISSTATIAHGLGRAPAVTLSTPNSSSSTLAVFNATSDATNIFVQASNPTSTSGAVAFSWLVIG